MDLSFLYAYLLIALALFYSYYKNLAIEKTIAKNSIIALFQLTLLGFVIGFALHTKELWQIISIMLFMLFYAAYIANKRTTLNPYGFWLSLATLSASALVVLLFLVIFGVISTSANQIIPLFGMALGNSLNIYAQFIERLKSDIELSIESIEGEIALGAKIENALEENIKKATKASLIPTINQLETVGIIHIPGVTVGMLLAGADPLKAVSFQLVIMFMMVAIALFTAIFASKFCLQTVFYSIKWIKSAQ